MIHRALDTNNDWTFGKGLQNFATGLDAIGFNIITRLKSWRGDSFSDSGEGVDWNNYLDYGTKDFLDRDILRVILQSDGVIRVIEFTSILEQRNLTVKATIETVYGIVSLREVF